MDIVKLLCVLVTQAIFCGTVYGQIGTAAAQPRAVFVQNQGQWPEHIRYQTRRDGVTAWITDDGVTYDFYNTESLVDPKILNADESYIDTVRRTGHVVRMNFMTHASVGASASAKKTKKNKSKSQRGFEKKSGVYNYFIGADTARWAANAPLYSEVDLDGIYKDIDLRLYHDDDGMRYDLIVEPGAVPDDIEIEMEGADSVMIDKEGALVIKTSIGDIKHRGLRAYQHDKGRRTTVKSGFKVEGKDRVRFELPDGYDSTKSLIIDPLIYSTYIGGSSEEEIQFNALQVDAAGNAYVGGWTTSSDDPPSTTGGYDTTFNGSKDAFVAKLDSGGAALLYFTYIGGGNQDLGRNIALGGDGSIYLAGRTISTDFPTTGGAYDTSFNGSTSFWDGFAAKLNPGGDTLIYATFLGGTKSDECYAIAVDSAGQAVVGGISNSTDFPATSGAYQQTRSGSTSNHDAIVTKLNAAGSGLVFATYFGGTSDERCYDLALDSQLNVYITGRTASSNLPTTTGAYDTTFGGAHDMFATKLNSTGSTVSYCTFVGGASTDIAHGLTLDDQDQLLIVGYTQSTDFPTTATSYQASNLGGWDAALCKLNTTATALLASTYFGGSGAELGEAIAIGPDATVYMSGSTQSSGLATADALDTTYDTDYDVMVCEFTGDLSRIVYCTYLGGGDSDRGHGIAIGAGPTIFVTGWTKSSDFHIQPSSGNDQDID